MKLTYTSIDGVRKSRSFKTLAAARKFAIDRVGPQDVEGGHYAVSNDGVGKITWDGVTRAELFGEDVVAAQKLNAVTTFYAKGDDLFCREAGYTRDHQNQLFARVIPVLDRVTGDYPDGFAVRHVDQLPLFDEDQHFATREGAMAYAKATYIAYLDYCANDRS